MRKHLYSLMAILILICTMAGIAMAQSDTPVVSIITPVNGITISGNQVEIAIGFDSTGDYPVSQVQVFLDGKPVTERIYDEPLPNGICTFKWDTIRTPNGLHKVDVQIFSEDTYLGMASCTVTVSNKAPDLVVPRVAITSPKEGQVVSGVTPIIVSASDNIGEPFVGVYVDNSLKLASNRGPYVYEWDTTKGENGPHYIEATASDQSDNSAKTKSVRVIVLNPVKLTPITALPVEEKPVLVAQNIPVPAPPASSATPREPADAKSESARNEPQSAAPEKFEIEQTAPKPSTAPAAKPIAKPVTVSKPVETPKPAVPVAAPNSSVSKPDTAPVLMAKLPSENISQPTVKADNKLATPAAPKPQAKPEVKVVPVVKETPKPVAKPAPVKVVAPVQKPAPNSSVSKPDTAPVLMAKLPETDAIIPVAKTDSKLAAPAAPKPQVKPATPVVKEKPVVKEAPKPVAKPAPVKMAKADTTMAAKAEVSQPDRPAGCKEYVLQPGDTVLELAAEFGVSAKAIIELNQIEDPRAIRAGDILLIPPKANMVAIRPVFEQANGTVNWDGKLKKVYAFNPQNEVTLKIGSAGAVVNSGKVTMDGPAVISSGRTLVPESFVTKTLGMAVPEK